MKQTIIILFLFVLAGLSTAGQETKPKSGAESLFSPQTQHWSFKPIQRSPVPDVQNSSSVRNSIDAFVLARLEKEQIKPSAEADRRTLIRRLSLDLLGLPPTPEEVRAFVSNECSDAFEQWVDQLLASPHFGERWARHWLDLARYADSDGYEKDTARPYAYLYRDWVIDAINRDLPFDQFTIEQLAGDLLPEATADQRIATGFHRNTLTNKEGGVDQEEFRCKATVDRVSTTSTVWLGLTVGCAECHTHKYDPITQREFYQLYAFFNNASEKDLPAPQPAELARHNQQKKRWDAEHGALNRALAGYLKSEIAAKQADWEKSFKLPNERWTVLNPVRVSAAEGATLRIQDDRSIQASGKSPAKETYFIEVQADLANITGFRLEILDDPSPAKGPGRGKDNKLVVSEFAAALSPGTSPLQPFVSYGTKGCNKQKGLIELQNASADHAPKDWPVADAIDGNINTGWAIDPEFDRSHVAVFETKENIALPEGAKLVFQLDQQHGNEHTIGRFRLSATTNSRPLKAHLTPDSVVNILSLLPAQRSEEQKAKLAKFYRDEIDSTARKYDRELADHAKKEPKFPETKAQTIAENDKPRSTHIHVRGDFLRKGDLVQPGALSVLHSFQPRGEKPDRLDLAQWLFDPANPLTARVTVNRVWHHLFGRGLVTSMDDFGARGEKPSHPELLDWLATEFRRLGWSRKALIKLIVTSSTYRQSSSWRSDLLERDPNNVLLARQNRFRLEAESLRDCCLAVAGLLNPTMGGPSIRPPLPADIAALGYANSVRWKESDGAERFRRGLYIFFQRTVPYPMLMTFDAPDSNVTCARRERSNTPLQALTLLNDPVFFECGQALGKRIGAMDFRSAKEKIRRTFEVCLAREPSAGELERLEKLLQDYERLAKSAPENANRIAGSVPRNSSEAVETAALVALSRTILNLDEFLTRE
ncbi:MAG: DUF1553 domain-containing protein [Verrucomicrobia bacterium]|nr:DUF1553 domain-containing protein [Verrucomicrobiota bacterium]